MPEVTKLSYVFSGCIALNSPSFQDDNLNGTGVNASFAYYNCTVYNQPTNWPRQGPRNSMFENCSSMNSPVPTVNLFGGNAARMFKNATSFNQPIGLFTGSEDQGNISEMFAGATSFNQDLSSWQIEGIGTAGGFMDGVTLSTANYDALLNSWAAQNILNNGVNISFGNSKFCTAEAARDHLSNTFNWNISDNGVDFSCLPQNQLFITTWTTTTTDEPITIPTFPGETYEYDIDWGDGVGELSKTGDATHNYAVPGTYTVQIFGSFPRIYFNNSGDKSKLTSIEQWGNQAWTSMEGAFHGCSNMTLSPTAGAPDLSGVTNMAYMFAGCSNFNTNINDWDVSTLEDGAHLFEGCTTLNQPFDNWQMPEVTKLSYVFSGCIALNSPSFQDDNLNGTGVNASFAYYNCTVYNQPTNWPRQGPRNSMFENCSSMNSPVPTVNLFGGNAARMFKNATSFNQPIGLFTGSEDQGNISEMFAGATSFNQDLSSWQIEGISSAGGFMDGVTLSTANYDALLNSWAAQNILNNGVSISFGNSKYCTAEAAREQLANTYNWNITDAGLDCSSGVKLSIKIFLQGAFDPVEGKLIDNLRTSNLIPTTEPYTAMNGFAHVNGGGETVNQSVLNISGNNAIVDWVFLELRSGLDPSIVLATRSALIQRDGDIVDVDGISPVRFDYEVEGYDFHLVVRHRNHLGVMSRRIIE